MKASVCTIGKEYVLGCLTLHHDGHANSSAPKPIKMHRIKMDRYKSRRGDEHGCTLVHKADGQEVRRANLYRETLAGCSGPHHAGLPGQPSTLAGSSQGDRDRESVLEPRPGVSSSAYADLPTPSASSMIL